MPANACQLLSNSALLSISNFSQILLFSISKVYLVNFFVLFLTIFGLEAGVSAIASERLTFKFQESFDEENFLGSDGRQVNETAVQQ